MTGSRHRTTLIAAGVVAALIAAGAFGVWWQFFRDDAPPPVSIEAAVAKLGTPTPASSSTSATSNPATPTTPSVATTTGADAANAASLDGAWAISTTENSFVGYRVGEELARVGTAEAVGRTSGVTGTAQLADAQIMHTAVVADLTSLTSDESLRDNTLRRQALQTGTYPTATFTLTAPLELGTPTEGETVHVTAHGDLTLHGVTRAIDIPLDVQLKSGYLVVVGSLQITFADYGIKQPSSQRVVSLDDHGQLELQLVFSRA